MGFGRLMLEMKYHLSMDMEVCMVQLAVWLLSSISFCSMSGTIGFDNL